MTSPRRRVSAVIVAVAALAAGLATSALVTQRGGKRAPGSPAMAPRFETLHRATSNRCSLQAGELAAMPGSMRLEGACCSAMDLATYQRQVAGLLAYRAVPEVPDDPYSIPVLLAKELVGYDTIPLTAAQQRVYDDAVARAKEHGPCCCACWRWEAFGGQARFLITRRQFTAVQVATVWDLEDGCGGAHA